MLTLTLPAAIESIETATDSLNEILEEAGCSRFWRKPAAPCTTR